MAPISDMAREQPDNLVLTLLRAIRADIAHMKGGIGEIKERIGFLEGGYASLSRRVDRMGGDVEQIRFPVEIFDAPTGQVGPDAGCWP